MLKLPIYLDNSATTPADPRVVDTMVPYFYEHFGNAASRSHPFGWEAEDAVDQARERIGKLIGATDKEIIITSGATEADNLAIKGVYDMYSRKGNHIVTVTTEHKAVLDTCKHLEKQGAQLTYLKTDAEGNIDLNELESVVTDKTIMVAVMYANNEIGTIAPIRQIADIAHKKGALMFSDATQAAGKISIDVDRDGIDLMAFTAHKMYGPKGVGALYVRRKNPRVKVTAQMDGGGHERGMRSGTLNVPGIVGFGKAAELAINGNRRSRLPHITNISFKYVEGEGLMMAFNQNIAVSSGSACTSASLEPSYVLKALGLGDDLAHSSIRFSLGRFTTDEQIQYTIDHVTKAVNKLRDMSPLWEMFKQGIDLNSIEWAEH